MTPPDEPTTPVLDIRTYKLVPGGRDEFDRLFRENALPMLHRFGVEVVAYGPSLEDDNYCLLRAFPSARRRKEQLDAFYGSDEWRQNHRDAVMALIEDYHVVALTLTPAVRHALVAAWQDEARDGSVS